MSGETELNDDSEDDVEIAWALFSVNSRCPVGATSCTVGVFMMQNKVTLTFRKIELNRKKRF